MSFFQPPSTPQHVTSEQVYENILKPVENSLSALNTMAKVCPSGANLKAQAALEKLIKQIKTNINTPDLMPSMNTLT